MEYIDEEFRSCTPFRLIYKGVRMYGTQGGIIVTGHLRLLHFIRGCWRRLLIISRTSVTHSFPLRHRHSPDHSDSKEKIRVSIELVCYFV